MCAVFWERDHSYGRVDGRVSGRSHGRGCGRCHDGVKAVVVEAVLTGVQESRRLRRGCLAETM